MKKTSIPLEDIIEAVRQNRNNAFDMMRKAFIREPLPYKGEEAVVFRTNGVAGVNVNVQFGAAKIYGMPSEQRAAHYEKLLPLLKDNNSPHLLPIQYYGDDFLMYTKDGTPIKLPVLCMDWAGSSQTLDAFIKAHLHEKDALRMLLYQFSQLVLWMFKQPFVHGNFRSDNILYQRHAPMALVDYDTLCFKEMVPTEDYPAHTDEMNMLAIGTSLWLLCLKPELWEQFYHPEDGLLLFTKGDCQPEASCELLKYAENAFPKDTLLTYFIETFKYICRYETRPLQHNPFIYVPECSYADGDTYYYQDIGYTDERLPWSDGRMLYSYDKLYLLRDLGYIFSEYKIKDGTLVICDHAFTNDFAGGTVKRIILPSSLQYIGAGAFPTDIDEIVNLSPHFLIEDRTIYNADKTQLISVLSRKKQFVIPATVREIAKGAFCGNSFVQEVTVPEGVTEIREETFKECSSLHKVHLPSSLKKIGSQAFYYAALQDLQLPPAVTELGAECFSGTPLQEVTLPDGIKTIPPLTFNDCRELKKVHLPASLTNIGHEAFNNCIELEDMKLPESVQKIGYAAFYRCLKLKDIKEEPEPVETSPADERQHITLPDSMRVITDSAFKDKRSLKSIVIPDSVVSIEDYAFLNCSSLEKVQLPSTLLRLGNGAFCGCSSLKELVIKGSLKAIGDYTFSDCTALERLVLPPTVLHMYERCLDNCVNLKEIWLPEDLNINSDDLPEDCRLMVYDKQEKETTNDHIAYELHGLSPQRTGVDYKIWLPVYRPGYRQEERTPFVKVETYESLISIAVSEEPSVLPGNDTTEFSFYSGRWKRLCQWLRTNLNLLLDHWNGKIKTDELLRLMKPLGPTIRTSRWKKGLTLEEARKQLKEDIQSQ